MFDPLPHDLQAASDVFQAPIEMLPPIVKVKLGICREVMNYLNNNAPIPTEALMVFLCDELLKNPSPELVAKINESGATMQQAPQPAARPNLTQQIAEARGDHNDYTALRENGLLSQHEASDTMVSPPQPQPSLTAESAMQLADGTPLLFQDPRGQNSLNSGLFKGVSGDMVLIQTSTSEYPVAVPASNVRVSA